MWEAIRRGEQKALEEITLAASDGPAVRDCLARFKQAGLPLLLIFSSLSLWLGEAGVERKAVTLAERDVAVGADTVGSFLDFGRVEHGLAEVHAEDRRLVHGLARAAHQVQQRLAVGPDRVSALELVGEHVDAEATSIELAAGSWL